MIQLFYSYGYNDEGRMTGTCCLAISMSEDAIDLEIKPSLDYATWAIGCAYTHPREQPSKDSGRFYARGRAITALFGKTDKIGYAGNDLVIHWQFMPRLTGMFRRQARAWVRKQWEERNAKDEFNSMMARAEAVPFSENRHAECPQAQPPAPVTE